MTYDSFQPVAASPLSRPAVNLPEYMYGIPEFDVNFSDPAYGTRSGKFYHGSLPGQRIDVAAFGEIKGGAAKFDGVTLGSVVHTNGNINSAYQSKTFINVVRADGPTGNYGEVCNNGTSVFTGYFISGTLTGATSFNPRINRSFK